MELHAALESGSPYEYKSSLPVHQDGTCNGLQHYAALGGDDQGARQVNLSVTDRPSDVYTFVADMVEKQIEKDIAKGEKYARMLSGKVSRKVVKQTVSVRFCVTSYYEAEECRLSLEGHDNCLWCYVHRRSRADREATQGPQ